MGLKDIMLRGKGQSPRGKYCRIALNDIPHTTKYRDVGWTGCCRGLQKLEGMYVGVSVHGEHSKDPRATE